MRSTERQYCFSAERREDLARLGVSKAQIVELEAVLPQCKILTDDHASLTDIREELGRVTEALDTLQRAIEAPTKATREALNRWQMAAYSLGHPMGSEPSFPDKVDLAALAEAARQAYKDLGSEQRRSHAATPGSVRLIDDALVRGWIRYHANERMHPYKRPRKFREIVEYCYEAIDVRPDTNHERARRAYSTWRKKEAKRLLALQQAIKAESEQFR
jgi:hypothetical protein